jgi:hypothetical protein
MADALVALRNRLEVSLAAAATTRCLLLDALFAKAIDPATTSETEAAE